MITVTINTKRRVYRWHGTFADLGYAVGTIACFIGIGVTLAWRG